MAKYNEKLLEGIVKFGIIYISSHKDSDNIFIPEKFLEMTCEYLAICYADFLPCWAYSSPSQNIFSALRIPPQDDFCQ